MFDFDRHQNKFALTPISMSDLPFGLIQDEMEQQLSQLLSWKYTVPANSASASHVREG